MDGEGGDAAGRLGAVSLRLCTLIERDVETLAATEPPREPAEIERRMKVYRAAALAGRGALDLSAAAARAARGASRDDAPDGEAEDGEGDGQDGPGLGPDQLDALRSEVERRYARFDRPPGGPPGSDPRAAGARPSPGG